MVAAADIFDSLAQEKKAKVERKRQKQVEEEKENKPAHSNAKAGNAARMKMPQVGYNQRPNRGQCRVTYNEGVNKAPGTQNQEGRIEVLTSGLPVKFQHAEPTAGYQFYNLTANARSQAMHEQFEVMEEILRQQLGMDAFHEFYSPDQALQSVCGRVVNLSTEDSKLKEQSIGLFNMNYGIQCRLRLNLA